MMVSFYCMQSRTAALRVTPWAWGSIAQSLVKGIGLCSSLALSGSPSDSEVSLENVAAKRIERQRARSVHLYRAWDLRLMNRMDSPALRFEVWL